MKPEDIKVGEMYFDNHFGNVKVLSIDLNNDHIYLDILNKERCVNYLRTNLGYIFSLIRTAPDLTLIKKKKDPEPKMFGLFSIN